MVIYIDVLLALNLFVNYFLLLCTSILMHRQTRRRRLLLSALIGSSFSFLIFLPDFGFVFTLITKLILGTLLTILTFGIKEKPLFLKTLLCFWGVNFVFGGVIFLVWISLSPSQMFYNNGITYVGISPVVLILGTLLSYCIIYLVNFILSRRVNTQKLCRIQIRVEGKEVSLPTLIDSGNHLTDPLGGLPVIVCEFSAVARLLPEELYSYFASPTQKCDLLEHHPWRNRIRVIPFHTVGTTGILGAFLPDQCWVNKNGRKKECSVLIGITATPLCDGEFTAIAGDQVCQ